MKRLFITSNFLKFYCHEQQDNLEHDDSDKEYQHPKYNHPLALQNDIYG
jgi:hypothetical protein